MGRTSDAKQRLVAAMADLVHQRGYRSVSVDEVCAAAGVRKGSFYHFFPSKRDLMLAALDQHWEAGRDHFLTVAFGKDVPPLRRVERFLTMVARVEAANKKSGGHVLGCPFGNVAAEMSTAEPRLAKRANGAFCGFATFVRDALREAQAAGDLSRQVDAEEAADAIVAYFEGLALLAKTRNDPAVIRRLGLRALHLATGGVPQRAARVRIRRQEGSR